uniref:Uncharacterized protein n=1 Tax=Craterostigma plantagineum TaxID=4153 RepID=Q84KR9_CRAPL|nr:hypothetical protein [Craterostigma plantagineum]
MEAGGALSSLVFFIAFCFYIFI